MILLQATLFLGFLLIPLPLVTFAHVCGLHVFVRAMLKKQEDFNTAQRVGVGVIFLILVYLAKYAIAFWSLLFAPFGLIGLKFPVLAIVIGVLSLIALLVFEAQNIYEQFFKTNQTRFSAKYYVLSMAMSIVVFACTMGGLYWFLEDIQWD
ncbi:hypothetical protein [Emticicia agri]|uniref:Uncharacterized protein n=1 Tax=Emticicia agri TaxID=2492393 RepID=A0A4Q5LVL6_9BACT|nr:hypothetical protein [Emticicia agri]RYU93599.1 hypothetical protein EWM59_21365 [Emticicia agri]